MKLLYSLLILGLMQAFTLKHLAAANAFKAKIVEYFSHELRAIDKDFCEKAMILSEKILQDTKVQKAATPKMQEFKQNITDFLHDYPVFERYGLINELVFLFEDKLPQPENNKNIQYIWQLLKKLGYNDISIDYEMKYEKFVKEKFLHKFEQLKLQLSAQELKQQQYLLQWFKGLKTCQDYKCYSIYFNSLTTQQTAPKQKLLKYITAELDRLNIFYGNKSYHMSKALVKNHNFAQLTPTLAQQLTIDLNKFIKKYESHHTIDQLYNLTRRFFIKILLKYYHNKTNITTQDHKLLVEIFDKQGCAELIKNYERKLLDFVQHDLLVEFNKFKAAVNRKELSLQKPLLQWYDQLKGLTNTMDMLVMFDKFHTMFYDKPFKPLKLIK